MDNKLQYWIDLNRVKLFYKILSNNINNKCLGFIDYIIESPTFQYISALAFGSFNIVLLSGRPSKFKDHFLALINQ